MNFNFSISVIYSRVGLYNKSRNLCFLHKSKCDWYLYLSPIFYRCKCFSWTLPRWWLCGTHLVSTGEETSPWLPRRTLMLISSEWELPHLMKQSELISVYLKLILGGKTACTDFDEDQAMSLEFSSISFTLLVVQYISISMNILISSRTFLLF